MNHYFLWTDQCFLGVLIVTFILIIRGLRKEQNRGVFLAIIKKPIAASASIILLFFLMTSVLDSIHFESRQTLLDQILAPLGEHYETTYSAPFALNLYASETTLVKGHVEQIYPRLTYPPPAVQTLEAIHHLVKRVMIKALCLSVLVLLFMGVAGVIYRCIRRILSILQDKQSFRRPAGRGEFKVTLRYGEDTITSSQDSSLKTRPSIGKPRVATFLTLFICVFIVFSTYGLSRYFHILGTGKIGQDIFYYAIKSIRTGLVIGTLTTLFMMPLALFLGISAGYFGGIVDDIIQYIYTTLSSIPGVLLITASVLSMQTYIANHPQKFKTLAENADARLLALCFILGVTSWTSLCRLLRAEALKLREVDFVLAAKALGSSSFKIITKHLLPNVMHIVIITLVLDFSFLVLAEAVLSYVGVGVSPMTISWGNMINAARLELAREPIVWWPMLAAFLLMFTLVLASNLLADAIRDSFDPHHA